MCNKFNINYNYLLNNKYEKFKHGKSANVDNKRKLYILQLNV